MDPVGNPYSPGAGTRPPTLVGRDKQVNDLDVSLQRLLIGRDGRGQLLTGLRGVGKTVLLNRFEQIAEQRGYFHAHIEVGEDGRLPRRIAGALRTVLLQMDAKRRIGQRARRALGVLKAFSMKIPDGPEIGLDLDAVVGPADSGDLSQDLAGLFVEIGEVARDHGCGVFLTIDELHYVPLEILAAMVLGLHRANQRGLPIAMAGAGLPSLPTLAGEAKSYAERMFTFPTVGSLSEQDANRALTEPSEAEGARWEGDALERIFALTQGYPYFIQEFGKQTWDLADGPSSITLDDVERAEPLAVAELDAGFFQVRTGRLSDHERSYLRAMAELGPGPMRSADVSKLLGKKTTTTGPVRDRLLKKGLCYSPRWGELGFTVPMFDQFMKRWIPSPILRG
ncbi:MAG: ATP-binding protein [Actinomycetota bacterium]|nr:ATP-binding protein [Actinomycetota bacterium]